MIRTTSLRPRVCSDCINVCCNFQHDLGESKIDWFDAIKREITTKYSEHKLTNVCIYAAVFVAITIITSWIAATLSLTPIIQVGIEISHDPQILRAWRKIILPNLGDIPDVGQGPRWVWNPSGHEIFTRIVELLIFFREVGSILPKISMPQAITRLRKRTWL